MDRSRAAVVRGLRAVSTVTERVRSLKGCVLLSLAFETRTELFEGRDAVPLGNGTVSVGNRFPTKTSGSIEASYPRRAQSLTL